MLAAAVFAIVFGAVFLFTWLSARAEAAEARCEAHLRHIQDGLEIPPSSRERADRRTPHGSG